MGRGLRVGKLWAAGACLTGDTSGLNAEAPSWANILVEPSRRAEITGRLCKGCRNPYLSQETEGTELGDQGRDVYVLFSVTGQSQ